MLAQTCHLKVFSLSNIWKRPEKNHLTNIKFIKKCHLPALEYLNLSSNLFIDLQPFS